MVLLREVCYTICTAHAHIYIQWNLYNYYGHFKTNQKCPDYQGVFIFLIILYDKVPFETSTKCLDYAGVVIFNCPR